MNIEISRVSDEIIMIEQYCPEASEMNTVMMTIEDLIDICLVAWPEQTQMAMQAAASASA